MDLKTSSASELSETRTRPGVNVLLVNASSRTNESVTRKLTQELLEEIKARYGVNQLVVRDVATSPLPVIDESWVAATFTSPEQRTEQQRNTLALSDKLVSELMDADVIILGVPIYNFGIPAALKAWIDLVARAGVTFRYTADGPVGLLENKHAFVVVASGGVKVDSEFDFATPHIRQVLNFIGIKDVALIEADRQNFQSDAAQLAARKIKQEVSSYQHPKSNAA